MRIAHLILAGVAAFAPALATPVAAQEFQSHCIELAETTPGVYYASFGDTLAADEVRLNFVGHSTYLLETAGGLTAATDFTGFVGADVLPDIVTMNRAPSSHYTDNPDPRIPHVLRGWGEGSEPAEHYLDLEELVVRNVTTDIRSGFAGAVENGNSIFVFEVAGLCIGHLGHIHHEPSDEQYALLGRVDVVMAPVDGGLTVPTSVMIKILKRLRSSVVLPMHWFGRATLEQFLDGMSEEFAVERVADNNIVVSLRTLPRQPTIYVLEPRFVDRAGP